MIFPAFCTDKQTEGLVYIANANRFKSHQHEYVRPVEIQTLEEIKSTSSSDYDIYMALKSKGWKLLNKEERALYQKLKLNFQTVESI